MSKRTFLPRENRSAATFTGKKKDEMSQRDFRELSRTLGQFDSGSSADLILKKIRKNDHFKDSTIGSPGIIALKSRTGYQGNHDVRDLHAIVNA